MKLGSADRVLEGVVNMKGRALTLLVILDDCDDEPMMGGRG
jgi:hypothetical protein